MFLEKSRLPKHCGICSKSVFSFKNKPINRSKGQRSLGMYPCKILASRYKTCSVFNVPTGVVIVPFKSLLKRLKSMKPLKLPISWGMLPLSLQSWAKRFLTNSEKFSINGGRYAPLGKYALYMSVFGDHQHMCWNQK